MRPWGKVVLGVPQGHPSNPRSEGSIMRFQTQ
ncbi:hypothetical protein TNCT_173991, partial [Trichonephila clavata]